MTTPFEEAVDTIKADCPACDSVGMTIYQRSDGGPRTHSTEYEYFVVCNECEWQSQMYDSAQEADECGPGEVVE